jgi:large subunit ribosomal protein L4
LLLKLESTGKTKDMFKTLSERNLLPGLVVTASKDSKAILAARNIRNAKSMSVEGFSVYEAVKFENLIIEKEALEKLLERLV